MHVTELKVRLDGSVDEGVRFWHWITYDALQEMHREGEVKRRPRRGKYYVEGEGVQKRGSEITFYYPCELTYADVADIIRRKLDLVNQYASISSEVGHYAEELVKEALELEDFKIEERNAREFKGKVWPNMKDVDFIAYDQLARRYYVIQVKNMLSYPDWDDIATLIDISDFFRGPDDVRPWFIARQMPGDYTLEIIRCRGFYTTFLKWLFPDKYRRLCDDLRQVLGLPVLCDRSASISLLREKFKAVHNYP